MAKPGGAQRFRIRIVPSILLTAAILLLPALLYAWGRQADSFEVTRVQVTGTKRLAKKEVLRLLRQDYLGQNLFTVTREDVLKTLHKLPYLAGVAVDREFPTTLRVRVVEYHPVAYVLSRDRWYVVSDTGHVIAVVGPKEATLTAETAGSDVTAVSGADAAVNGGTTEGALVDGAASGQDASGGDASGDATSGDATAGDATGSDFVTSGDATASASPSPSTTETAGTDAGAAADVAGQAAPDAGRPARSAGADPAAVAAALRRGPKGASQDLPRIACSQRLRLDSDVRDEDVRTALTVLDGLPSSLRQRVAVVDVQPGDQVTLTVDGGLEIEVGSSERLVAKVLSLRAVLQAYDSRGKSATYVDVSIPDRPLARPRLTS